MKIKSKIRTLVKIILLSFVGRCTTLDKYNVSNYGYSIDYLTPEQKNNFTKSLKRHFRESNFETYEGFLMAVNSCGKVDSKGKPTDNLLGQYDLNRFLSNSLNNENNK